MSKKFKVGSMFAGIGGICQGFKDAGFDIVWANEYDKMACIVYKHLMKEKYNINVNYLEECNINDITSNRDRIISIPNIDILTAGFPCQSFSIAGERKGFNDERGELFFRIMDIVDVKCPKIILLENVKNLEGHDNGKTFKNIKNELGKRGYFVKYSVFDTSKFTNIPQHRERIFIVAFFNEGYYNEFQFPELTTQTITKIEDFIDLNKICDKKYYYKYGKEYLIKSKDDNIREKYINYINEINEFGVSYQIRRGMYLRKNKSNIFPTLTANMGCGGHNIPIIKDNFGIRKITPEECFLLQGFNLYTRPFFKITKKTKNVKYEISDMYLYKQAGNSVTVPLITRISEKIKEVLDVFGNHG